MAIQTLDATRSVSGAYAVDLSRGTTNHRVSSQWWNRPDDQRYLNLDELHRATFARAQTARTEILDAKDIRVRASREDNERLELELPDGRLTTPTHWSFGQLCSLVRAPAGYLRQLPATIAGINLQWGLSGYREEKVKAYTIDDDPSSVELRAATGPDYGRIFDHEVVAAVRKIAGNGVGDTRWKVPGLLEGFGRYNPFVDVTKETTTLFASDRDVFLFLVDDTHPIEIGKLPNGDPDLVFRGFYVWNSEVGARSFGIATMYLRGVCCNRILWGVEGFQEIAVRHSKYAPDRFMLEAMPALESYANAATGRLLAGISAAREAVVARNDDERRDFLTNRGFSRKAAASIIETVVQEEGKAPESVWDFVAGITAAARKVRHQDARLDMERQAGRLLDKVAA